MSDFGWLSLPLRMGLLACCVQTLARDARGQESPAPPAAAPIPSGAAAPTSAAPSAPSGTAPAPAVASPSATPAPNQPVKPVSPSVAPSSGDEQVDLKIKGLEEQVNDLKEKIFRTKSRLLLLQESVLGGDISSSAKSVLYHTNEMGSSFVLESATYTLDGAPIFSKVDNGGDLADKPSFEIFNGLIVPGNHQITVRLVYRGHGYGLFTYLEGYKFKVQSSYTFNAEPGRLTVVKVVGFEKGGLTTELKDRPAVRYDVEVSKEKPALATPASPSPAAAGSPPAPVTGQ
jgi:hypothetical protein